MSTTQKTSTAQEKPADPRDTALAELRAQVANLEAAVGRLQEIAADAVLWAECPCGGPNTRTFRFDRAIIINGRLWHDQGHHTFFGGQVGL